LEKKNYNKNNLKKNQENKKREEEEERSKRRRSTYKFDHSSNVCKYAGTVVCNMAFSVALASNYCF